MRGGGRRRRRGREVALLAVALLLAAGTTAGVPGAIARAASPGAGASAAPASTGGYSWSNGIVRLAFASAQPTFTVTSASNASLSVAQSLGGLAEVAPSGRIVAMASFGGGGAHWQLTPTTGATGTQVVLRASVPVVTASGEWESGDDTPLPAEGAASVAVAIVFTLNASGGGAPATVAYNLSASAWPWASGNDSLGVEVRSNLSASVGYWQVAGANSVAGIARSSSAAFVRFSWGTSARASYADGREAQSSVDSYHNSSPNGSSSLVRLDFTPVPGGYSGLSYDPWVELIAPAPGIPGVPSWVVTPLSLGILVAGAAGSLVLAAVAYRRRVPPERGL